MHSYRQPYRQSCCTEQYRNFTVGKTLHTMPCLTTLIPPLLLLLQRRLLTWISTPRMMLMLISYLDRGNIGFAATQGMADDIGLVGNQLNVCALHPRVALLLTFSRPPSQSSTFCEYYSPGERPISVQSPWPSSYSPTIERNVTDIVGYSATSLQSKPYIP